MNFLIIFLIFLLNAGGIGLVYLLVKEKTQMQRIIYVAASFTIMYIIGLLVYVIACIGIDDVNNTYYRTNVVLLIAPINLLATVPLLIKSYKDMKNKKISFNKFSNTVTVAIVVLLVLCVCEVFAIKLFLKNNSSDKKTKELFVYENNSVDARELLANITNEQSSNTSSNTTNSSLNSQGTNSLTNETNNSLNTNVENSESNTLSNSLNSEDSSSSNSISSNNESVVSNIETNPNGIGILVN